MNLVLLATPENQSALLEFCKALSESQKTSVNGVFAIFRSCPYMDVSELTSKFKIFRDFKTLIPGTLKGDGKIAALMSAFTIHAYAKFPGPWLVVDGAAFPRGENPLDFLDMIHAWGGKPNSGHGIIEKIGPLLIGPMVIGAKLKSMNPLIQYANMSWREKARHYLARSGITIFNWDNWPFFVPNFSARDILELTPVLPEKKVVAVTQAPVVSQPIVKKSQIEKMNEARAAKRALQALNA